MLISDSLSLLYLHFLPFLWNAFRLNAVSPFTCCTWFPCPIPTYLLWMSSFPHALPQCSLIPTYRTAELSFYIHLSLGTMNTAWSVRHVLTYLNDDTSCISFNFNLLDSPLSFGSLRVSMLLLSVCSLVTFVLGTP